MNLQWWRAGRQELFFSVVTAHCRRRRAAQAMGIAFCGPVTVDPGNFQLST